MTDRVSWLPDGGDMGALIRAKDWSATPLGALESWPPELKAVTGLLLSQDFAMILLWGPELIQIYNDGYRSLMGDKHPAGLGAPTQSCWPEVWAFNAPIYNRVLDGETVTLADQLFPIERHGRAEDAWFTLSYSPARLSDGRIEGVFLTVLETTARLQEERRREQRFRTLFDSIDEGFYFAEAVFDQEGRCADIFYQDENSAAVRMVGQSFKGRRLSELGAYEESWRETFGAVARTGEPRRLEQFAEPNGIWFDFYAFKPSDAGPNEFAVVFRDVTERRRSEERLRESEQRLRRIVETARDYAIFTTDREGRVDQWYPGAQAVFGWSPEEIVGQPVEITFTPEDNAEGAPRWEREIAAAEGSAPNVRWHVKKGGDRVFIDGIMAALRSADGRLLGFLKIGQDTTERRRAEEHQKMLLGELQHRVRNTLGVIRSIGRRTAESSADVEDMWSHLEGRIDAFSRVQAAVTRKPDAGVDLASLIEDELRAHAAREGERLRVSGPDLALKPRTAETLSLAIHELATNAVKYGALGAPTGMLSVTWRRELGRLELFWEEGGLQGLSPTPARHGFGLELLQRTLPYELDAESRIEFRPQGLRFALSVPLGPNVLAE
jgi:PAS domain S-box-containing protein